MNLICSDNITLFSNQECPSFFLFLVLLHSSRAPTHHTKLNCSLYPPLAPFLLPIILPTLSLFHNTISKLSEALRLRPSDQFWVTTNSPRPGAATAMMTSRPARELTRIIYGGVVLVQEQHGFGRPLSYNPY